MNGFHAQKQSLRDSWIGKRSTANTLTCLSVSLCLCLTSGCVMTRRMWSGLHDTACGETAPACSCTCGKCGANNQVEHEVKYPDGRPLQSRAYAATPSPLEDNRPIDHGNRPQAATMNGMPGTWIPSPQPTHAESAALNEAQANNPGAEWSETHNVAVSPPAQMPIPDQGQQRQWPSMQSPAMHPPDAAAPHDVLKEYRAQIGILSEQISHMRNAQDSMKVSQESLQQSHEREILELKLQQTTTDRDRLQREHELERQLERQRQSELETIDSLSQIIEGVVPAPAGSSGALAPVPRTTTQANQVLATPPQNLPTVDESF